MTTTAYIENRKWKIVWFDLTIVYCLFSSFAVPVFAVFEDAGTGARGLTACVAGADDRDVARILH